MTTKHEIEIPDLPDGWRAVAYRTPVKNVDCVLDSNRNAIRLCDWSPSAHKWLIVERIKPRRIVLEETMEVRRALPGEWCENKNGEIWFSTVRDGIDHKIWRVVEE